MNLKAFLLFTLLLIAWILVSKVYMLLYYSGVFAVLVSYLNTRAGYKKQPYKWINLLFFIYMLLIVWERTRHYKFSPLAELAINDAEHIFFAVIISTLIALLLLLTIAANYSHRRITAITIITFNVVGVVNECFQNILAHRPVFVFIPDSKKDLLMNILGSAVFLLLAYVHYKTKPRTAALQKNIH